MGFFSRAFLVFLMKESKKRRLKQLGKLMAKSHSQPVNLWYAALNEPPERPKEVISTPFGHNLILIECIILASEDQWLTGFISC